MHSLKLIDYLHVQADNPCSIPTPFSLNFMSRSDMFLGVDSLSSKSSAYFEYFVQELMIITDSSLAISFDFRRLDRRLVLLESIM